jgi:hypothetical protein
MIPENTAAHEANNLAARNTAEQVEAEDNTAVRGMAEGNTAVDGQDKACLPDNSAGNKANQDKAVPVQDTFLISVSENGCKNRQPGQKEESKSSFSSLPPFLRIFYMLIWQEPPVLTYIYYIMADNLCQ